MNMKISYSISPYGGISIPGYPGYHICPIWGYQYGGYINTPPISRVGVISYRPIRDGWRYRKYPIGDTPQLDKMGYGGNIYLYSLSDFMTCINIHMAA